MRKIISDAILMILMTIILTAMVNLFGLTVTTVGTLAYLLAQNILND